MKVANDRYWSQALVMDIRFFLDFVAILKEKNIFLFPLGTVYDMDAQYNHKAEIKWLGRPENLNDKKIERP